MNHIVPPNASAHGDGWAKRVCCVKVELHGDYTVEDCEADLRRLGYRTLPDLDHVESVVGIRSD